MKTASSDLIALLATRNFYKADLFVFALVDGTILRYTSGDRNIKLGSDTYACGGLNGPIFDRSTNSNGNQDLCTQRRGLQADTLQFDVMPQDTQINGVDFLEACSNGIFDGAIFSLDRAFMPTYGDTSVGVINRFYGRVAEIDAGDQTYATFQIVSFIELLNQSVPRNIFMASCMNSLFDASCGLIKANFEVTGAAGAGSTESLLNVSLGNPDGYFNQGTVSFTSGPNTGVSRTVKSYAAGVIRFITPLPSVPGAGDTFNAYPGCLKTQLACAAFNNSPRFRGFPFVPSATTAA